MEQWLWLLAQVPAQLLRPRQLLSASALRDTLS